MSQPERRTIFLSTQRSKEFAKQVIDNAPKDYVCKISQRTRSDGQNKIMWALIADLQRQVPEMALYSADDIKNRFLNALGVEMRFLPELEGQGMFPVGMRSSTLTVEQFTGLIELIYQYGARHNVPFHAERNAA